MAVPETFPDLPGWTFEVDELSAGAFQVSAERNGTHLFDFTGFDADLLLKRARERAHAWEKL
jgi:hypothetical protein